MAISFIKSKLSKVEPLIKEYVETLSSPIDSFLEDHILHSTFYVIHCDSEVAGYFAVYDNERLTQFYLRMPFCHASQQTFQRVLTEYAIESIFVPTCDELFLSLVLDHDLPINHQAYFFQDSKAYVPGDKLYKDGILRPAKPVDADRIVQVSGDFLDKIEERIENGQVLTFSKNNELLGIGVLERGQLMDGYASIGMFTNEKYRRQGVGRTIICALKDWCYAHDLTPICGCYYYNDASKQTLESAGMVTKTRLLNVEVL